MKEFIEHLTAYVLGIGALMVLNILSDPRDLWFLWIAFFWGIGLAYHAVEVFMGDGTNLARAITDRIDRTTRGEGGSDPVSPSRPVVTAPERAPSQSEIRSIITMGQDVVDDMRARARSLPQGQPRRDVLTIVFKSDEILMVIEEQPNEVLLARDFLNGLLVPVGKLVEDYSRLVVREIPSAQPTLRAVEENDLPALIKRIDGVYERLHRGNLIDLEVAREMMSLDTLVPSARVE